MKLISKLLLLLISSGFLIYVVNTSFIQIAPRQDNNLPKYWFQEAYFRNEIYLYLDQIKKDNLLQKLKFNSKDLKTHNINTLEYLNMYNKYINQLEQLSRMIFEIGENATFIMSDIINILNNLTFNTKIEHIVLIKEIKEHIVAITSIKNKIKMQNQKINNFKVTIKKEYLAFVSNIKELSNENNETRKITKTISSEIPLVALIGKIKYNNQLGLNNPDYLLKPLRDFGNITIVLNHDYEKLLSIYNQQIKQQTLINQIVNYLIYLIFILLSIYQLKNENGLSQ